MYLPDEHPQARLMPPVKHARTTIVQFEQNTLVTLDETD